MPEIPVKGRVTRDRRIEAVAPEGIPEGEVDLIIRVSEKVGNAAVLIRIIKERAARAVEDVFEEVDQLKYPRRTAEEIEADIAAERASWGD